MFLKSWFLLSVSSAVLIAVAQIFDKLLTREVSPQVIPAVKKIINGLILLSVLSLLDFPTLTSLMFWKLILLLAFLDLLATLFYFIAIKDEEVSKILPYRTSLIVLLTFVGAILFLSETFTPLKGAGGLLIAIGAYLILSNGKVKYPKSSKGIIIITASGLLYAIYELTVKIGVSKLSPILLAVLVYFISGGFLWIYNIILNRKEIKSLKGAFSLKFVIVLLIACLGASFSLLSLYSALSMGPASIVLPLVHTAPLFLVIFSGKILKEKNTAARFMASTIIVAGMILLYLI